MENKEKPMFLEDLSENDIKEKPIFSEVERKDIKADISSDLVLNEAKGNERNSNIDNLDIEQLTDQDLEMWKKHKEWIDWVSKVFSVEELIEEDKEYIRQAQEDFTNYTTYTSREGGDSAKLRAYIHDKLLNRKLNILYI